MFKMPSFKWQWEHHGSIHFHRELFAWAKANVKSSCTLVFTICCLEQCRPYSPWPQLACTPFLVLGRLLNFPEDPCFLTCCFAPGNIPRPLSSRWLLSLWLSIPGLWTIHPHLSAASDRSPRKHIACHPITGSHHISLSILHTLAQWTIDDRCPINISHGKDLKAIKHRYSQVDLCKNQVTFRKKRVQIYSLE